MKLALLIADTLPDKRLAREAVERTLGEVAVAECVVVSDTCFVAGARHVRVAPLRGLSDYNALMLDEVVEHLACDACLVVQWDGFAIDGRRWREDFLAADYVGAPWVHRGGRVGAGGFSLRSRRLFEAVRALRTGSTSRSVDVAEDAQICESLRPALESAGLRFAPRSLAAAFAFERVDDALPPATLGFHGAFNFPLVLAEDAILARFEEIVARLPATWPAWHLMMLHAWRRGYEDLGRRLGAALARLAPRPWAQAVQASIARGVPPAWLEAAA